VIIFIDKDDI
jgi:hypothetical protein